ncbi:MAG: response regulator [Gammaproteobacteria bacterium]|nr:response regulator [Gammaproteobacteria bacterium]
MMIPDYRDQKVLLIEDFPEFRFSLKGMVQEIGFLDVDMVADGELALEKCLGKRYDIILSDYNLGEGKDGQQVLEELIHRDLLKATTVYVMITAENTTSMVMGALEYTPDSYLAKPFTKALLKSRLDKLMAKKYALGKINRAITIKDYSKAIKQCDLLIDSASKYKMACKRIKADLFDKMGDLGHSRKIYAEVIENRPVPWALMGMGKIHYAQEQYKEALVLFEKVTATVPTFPEALDWLSRVQQVLGNPVEAQKILQAASSISPKAILRQMHLGNLALINKDYDVARRAFKTSIKLGRDSCYKAPENYLNLAYILKENLTASGGIKNKRIMNEALITLDELEKDYNSDKEIRLRATTSRHAIYHKIQNSDKAEQLLNQAKQLYTELKEQLSGVSYANMAQACKDGEDYETCNEIISNILEKFSDDKDLMTSLEHIIEDKSALEKSAKASKINTIGMKAAACNDTDNAIDAFNQAIAIAPDNVSFNMNLAQVLLRKAEVIEDKKSILKDALVCLDKVKNIQKHDHRYLRYQQLLRIANNLNIGIQNS